MRSANGRVRSQGSGFGGRNRVVGNGPDWSKTEGGLVVKQARSDSEIGWGKLGTIGI